MSSLRKGRTGGYQLLPLRIIFGVKVDLRRKSRLVIGGHPVNSSGHEVYARTMKLVSYRILLTVSAANKIEVMMGEIGNVYLNASTEEKIYTCAVPVFELVSILDKGNLL